MRVLLISCTNSPLVILFCATFSIVESTSAWFSAVFILHLQWIWHVHHLLYYPMLPSWKVLVLCRPQNCDTMMMLGKQDMTFGCCLKWCYGQGLVFWRTRREYVYRYTQLQLGCMQIYHGMVRSCTWRVYMEAPQQATERCWFEVKDKDQSQFTASWKQYTINDNKPKALLTCINTNPAPGSDAFHITLSKIRDVLPIGLLFFFCGCSNALATSYSIK